MDIKYYLVHGLFDDDLSTVIFKWSIMIQRIEFL
jgi:hypothetical protein